MPALKMVQKPTKCYVEKPSTCLRQDVVEPAICLGYTRLQQHLYPLPSRQRRSEGSSTIKQGAVFRMLRGSPARCLSCSQEKTWHWNDAITLTQTSNLRAVKWPRKAECVILLLIHLQLADQRQEVI